MLRKRRPDGRRFFASSRAGICTPHFLCLRQRKRAVHGPKETAFVPQILALAGSGLLEYGSCWLELPTDARKSSAECAGQYGSNNPVSAGRVAVEHWGGQGLVPAPSIRAFTVSACGPPSISVTSEKCFTGSSFRFAKRCRGGLGEIVEILLLVALWGQIWHLRCLFAPRKREALTPMIAGAAEAEPAGQTLFNCPNESRYYQMRRSTPARNLPGAPGRRPEDAGSSSHQPLPPAK